MPLPKDSERCLEESAYDSSGHLGRCTYRAKYDHYCGVHSPIKKAERAAKRGPHLWEREAEARKARTLKLKSDAWDEGYRAGFHDGIFSVKGETTNPHLEAK